MGVIEIAFLIVRIKWVHTYINLIGQQASSYWHLVMAQPSLAVSIIITVLLFVWFLLLFP